MLPRILFTVMWAVHYVVHVLACGCGLSRGMDADVGRDMDGQLGSG